jgi:hypothetical protein
LKQLPRTDNPLVVRTDFSNDEAWEAICTAIRRPSAQRGFEARVSVLSDAEYDHAMPEQLLDATRDYPHTFLFVADRLALSDPEQRILVVDLHHEPGRAFRVIPSEVWGVENNLSIANMDFFEFADSTDPDGVFRGFPDPTA